MKFRGKKLLLALLDAGLEFSAIALAKKGTKLTPEEIEELQHEYPDIFDTLENPVFITEPIPKSPVRSLSIPKESVSSKIEYVTNPKTGRQIQVGGETFSQLQEEGYMYVNNRMVRR